MTKKDFELIAGVLRATDIGQDFGHSVDGHSAYLGAECDRANVTEAFADALQHTNPRFDRERFIAAATGRES